MSEDSSITPPNDRGQGDTSLLTDPHHKRADLRLLRRAVLNGWPVPDSLRAKLVERLEGQLDDPDSRVVAAAIRSGIALHDSNLKTLEVLDKLDRLDAGESTENVRSVVKIVIE
jgi:hypothetical protein